MAGMRSLAASAVLLGFLSACAQSAGTPPSEELPPPPLPPVAKEGVGGETAAVPPLPPADETEAATDVAPGGPATDPGPVDVEGGAVTLTEEERREERLRTFQTFDADSDPSVQSVGIARRRGWTALKF